MILFLLVLVVFVCVFLICVVCIIMVEEMDKDYVCIVIGNGVLYLIVICYNVLCNVLIMFVIVFGLCVGYLLGGVVVIE